MGDRPEPAVMFRCQACPWSLTVPAGPWGLTRLDRMTEAKESFDRHERTEHPEGAHVLIEEIR